MCENFLSVSGHSSCDYFFQRCPYLKKMANCSNHLHYYNRIHDLNTNPRCLAFSLDSYFHQNCVSLSYAFSPSAEALFSDHVVGGRILLPGVGYLEMTFIAILGRVSAFTDVSFMRPCWLPEPGSNEKCVLRCTRRGEGPFEIASWRGKRTSMEYEFKTHFRATLKVAFTASSKQIPNRTHVSWNVTNKMGAQNTNIPRMMPDVDFCGKVHASAMGVPMGRMAWFLSAREVLCNLSRQGARPLCSTGHVASIKRTLLLPARQQLCKPLCGSILSSRSPLLASQAWDKS